MRIFQISDLLGLLRTTSFFTFFSFCQAQDKCGNYYCEEGTCCGERLCCTHYYYKTWWFWIIWCVLALLCCCCFYQKRRFQEQIRQRIISYRNTYIPSMVSLPRSNTPDDIVTDQQILGPLFQQGHAVKLPTYDEISNIPKDPPAYDVAVHELALPETRIHGDTCVAMDDSVPAPLPVSAGPTEGGTDHNDGNTRARLDTDNSQAPLLTESEQEVEDQVFQEIARPPSYTSSLA